MIDINIISYRFTDPYFLQMFFAFCLKNRPLGTWFEILLGCGGCYNHLTYEVTSFMQKNDAPIWRLVGNPYHLPWKKYLYKLWSIYLYWSIHFHDGCCRGSLVFLYLFLARSFVFLLSHHSEITEMFWKVAPCATSDWSYILVLSRQTSQTISNSSLYKIKFSLKGMLMPHDSKHCFLDAKSPY